MGPPVSQTLIDETCGTDPSWVCQQMLESTDGNEFLARTADFLIAKPLQILLILLIAFIANRLVRRAIRRFADRVAEGRSTAVSRRVRHHTPSMLLSTGPVNVRSAARAQTIAYVLRSLATAVIYAIATLLVLGELGIDLGPLLAGAGIVGVAVGFGAQSLVKDFLSGIFMLVEDQYGVGDVVDVGEADGVVEAVTLRSTRLRDTNGTVWHVPNGEIRRVGNKSQQWARAVIDMPVALDADIRKAEQLLADVAHDLVRDPAWTPRILEEPDILGVESLRPDGVVLRVMVKTKPAEQWAVMRELRIRLKEAFEAEGIPMPPVAGSVVMAERAPSRKPAPRKKKAAPARA
jgi:moderate conductance mechanosensitive channel